MAKITSKLQVTIPKALAEAVGVEPGDEIVWSESGGILRLAPVREQAPITTRRRLVIFDRASERQGRRERAEDPRERPAERGWRREDLYDRGRPR